MKTSLPAEVVAIAGSKLQKANAAFQQRYPGESGARQPVHTVYGGAHLFKRDTAARLGELAVRALDEYGPDAASFGEAVGLSPSGEFRATIYARVREKLKLEPVEDFRIDFEDGYGNRPDAEEDGHAASAAAEVAAGLAAGTLPPFIGIRIKPFSEELSARSIRTLDIFLSTLLEKSGGKLPGGFVVTLPKIVLAEQVAALADLFEGMEPALGLAAGALRLEMMIETPQSIISARGEINLPKLLEAARGRCVAAHFGTYDYTASCSITAAHQHMLHPACDFAKQMMQVSFAGTGVWLSDGATNILPVGPHRAAEGAKPTAEQKADNRAAVHRAWRLHFEHIQHSLIGGFYQGWDLHPAQLPTRYAAVYSFFLEGLDSAAARLKNFVEKAAKATLVGDIFDDAATGQGLLNYFLRAINSGAVIEAEVLPLTGLTHDELRLGSFVKILKARTRKE